MRTTLLRFLPLLALFATGCVIEVEDDDDDWSGTAGGGWAGGGTKAGAGGRAGGGTAGTAGTSGTGGAGGAGGGEEAPAFVRFAHLAPNTDAVDVCLRPVGFAADWSHPDFVFGPIFAQNAAEYGTSPEADPALAPNARDFYFPGVSTYFELSPPGAWQVRLVPAALESGSVPSCETAVEGVVDLPLDLRSGQVLTVALAGDRASERGGAVPLPLGWAPYGEPDADPAVARGHLINALSGGDEVTLATIDPITQEVSPVGEAPAALAGTDVSLELAAAPARYVLLGAPIEDGTSPLLTATPKTPVSAKPGELWTFFAAGTRAGEEAEALRPQTIACRNALQGAGLNDASLIAADCIYINSATPVASTPPLTKLRGPAPAWG